MSDIEKNWLTKYRWTGDETPLPVKAEALKAASEYTIELEQQNARLVAELEQSEQHSAVNFKTLQKQLAELDARWEKLKEKMREQYREVTNRIVGDHDSDERQIAEAERRQVGSLLFEVQQIEREGGK